MAKEQIQAEVVTSVDQQSLKQSQKELERLSNPVSVKMAMDISDARLKLKTMRDEYNSMTFLMKRSDIGKSLGSAIELQAKQVTKLNRELTNFVRTGDKELSVLGKLFRQVGIDIDSGIGKRLLSATDAISWFASKGPIALAGVAIATGLYKIGSASLGLADRLEQATISFETMLGSATDAQQLLKELSVFASKTPFELPDVRSNAKQLLAMGIGVKDLIPTMKALGDVSAGLSVPMDRLALAYGQVIAKGKLQGGELKQFTEAGVPLIETLSKKLGVSTQEFYKMVEAGKVSSWDVVQAFQIMTEEGGKFNNLMLKQSSTLSGMYSNFKDQLSLLWEKIGTALLPAGKAIIWIGQAILGVVNSPQVSSLLGFFGKVATALYYLSGAFIVFETMKILVNWVTRAFEVMSPTIMYVAEAISTAMDALLTLIDQVKSYFTDMIDTLTGSTSDSVNQQVSLWEYLGAFISTLFISLVGLLQGTFQTIADGWNSAVSWMTDDTTTTTDKMVSLFVGAGSAILNTILGLVNKTVNLILIPINTAIDWLNALSDLANKAGADIGKIWNIKMNLAVWDWQWVFDKIGWGLMKWLESFSKNVNNATQSTMDSVFEKRMKSIESQWKKEIALSNKKVSVMWGIESEWEKKSWKANKEKEKALKESVEKQKKYFKELADIRKTDIKALNDNIKKLKDAMTKIDEINGKIDDVLAKSGEETANTVAGRYRTLLEAQKSVKDDLATAMLDVSEFKPIDPSYAKQLSDIDTQIKEIESSGLLDQNRKSAEQQRASLDSLWQERFDFQAQLSDIKLKESADVQALNQERTAIENELGLKRDQMDREAEILALRKTKNETQLRQLESLIKSIEAGITDATKSNIQTRLNEYEKEERKLRELIALRMSAWMAIATPVAPIQNNTVNNSPTVNVNAQVASNVDSNYLANTLAQKLLLSNKWIN